MTSSRGLVLVLALAAFGCGPERATHGQVATAIAEVGENRLLLVEISGKLDALGPKLDALATPPTTIEAPAGAFWLGPRDCATDAPCAVTLFFGQGKPADLQLVPYVQQGAPAAPVPKVPAK